MSDALLEARDLDAFYSDFQALFGITFSIAPKEVVAIIGANGAGKSTLMRSLTGLIINEPGMVRHNSENIGSLRADLVAKRGIAMVPEGRQLFPSLSVEENLIIGGQVGREGDWDLATVYKLFPILEERRNQQSTSLSGGQQQMVAIGRALMANPEIILFDEISLGLAPIIIKSIYEALPQIIETGVSAVVVEQDISKALEVSDRVYCLQEGRVSLEGPAKGLDRAEITKAYFGMAEA